MAEWMTRKWKVLWQTSPLRLYYWQCFTKKNTIIGIWQQTNKVLSVILDKKRSCCINVYYTYDALKCSFSFIEEHSDDNLHNVKLISCRMYVISNTCMWYDIRHTCYRKKQIKIVYHIYNMHIFGDIKSNLSGMTVIWLNIVS